MLRSILRMRGISKLMIVDKRRALPIAWLALCLCVCAVPASAAPEPGPAAPFIVDSWSTEEGLPDSEAISVVQSRDGYLWIGTLHGLVRFDGSKFTVFNQMNTPGLTSDRIVCLFEDRQTNLWIGTESSGVEMMRNGWLQNFGPQTANLGAVLYAYEDAAGNVWFDTDRGILSYRAGRMTAYPGVVSQQLLYFVQRAIVPSSTIGSYWRIQNGLVQKWAGRQLEKDLGAVPWGNTVVKAACEDADGNLIVGTQGAGIYWLQADGKFRHIGAEQGLSSDYILSLVLDHAGDLWAGTDGGGLNRIRRKVFESPATLSTLDAQSLCADPQGGFWAAFNAAGLAHWGTNGQAEFFPVGLRSNAWTVLMTRDGQTWAGTRDEGLFHFRDGRFIPASGTQIPGPQIYTLFEDRSGRLWAGTQNGLACWDGAEWKRFTARDGLSENIIRAIAEDTHSNLWLGTESRGLQLWRGTNSVAYRVEDGGLPGNDISCLYADKDGVLWVGTFGHGFARLQDDKWTRYAVTNGLASDSISYLAGDDPGNLWVGSNMGLMRIPQKSLADVASGVAGAVVCRTYGKADGLPSRECSAGSQPATTRTADGRLWFPTTKGVVSVNPVEIKTNPQPPAVMIESVLVDGSEQKTNRLASSWRQSITIPPGGEELEIHYTALNFSAPEQVRFKCWLEGHEAKPTDVGGERIARYPKLPPGLYHFHVTACNEDGVWNEAGSVLDITVQPQFWQTGWFRAGTIIFILGLVVAFVRYVSTQKLQRQLLAHQQREALEGERARIARDLHDQLGANLTQVALLGEMAEADKESPAEIEQHAQQISQTARETTRSLDEIVWAINPANDTLEGLANYACKYAQEYFSLAGLRCRADVPAQLPAVPIPPEVRHNVFLAFKEAVHNVVKHAQAAEAKIRLRLEPGQFIFEIEDNGRGVANLDQKQNRNGLRNMKRRMADIGGSFEIGPAAEQGTIVRLTVPIK